MKSLNLRVLASAGLVLAVFLVFTAVALDRAFHESALASKRERMLGQVFLLMGAAEIAGDGTVLMPQELPVPEWSMPGSGQYAYVVNRSGGVLWRSPSTTGTVEVPIPFLDPGQKTFLQEELPTVDGTCFIQAYGVRWSTEATIHEYTFATVSDRSSFIAEVMAFRRTLWGWLGLTGVLLLAAQSAVLRWGLQPLRTLIRELNAIETGDQERVEGSYPRELQRLTEDINTLLHHERARQKRYRDGLADLAHSLKTPLAILRGMWGRTDDTAEARRVLEEQVSRMDSIVQYQLQRAATAGRSSIMRPVLLRPICDKLVETLHKVHRQKAVKVEVRMEEGVQVRSDEGDLTELLGNLLDNAFKWCRSRVRVSASSEGRRLMILVDDDGPGFSPELVQARTVRGVRADEKTPGHGIGLAMVADIVRAYDGELSMEQSDLAGASVRVRLPA